jgi:quercetin dioxygenase-like cupin family protein
MRQRGESPTKLMKPIQIPFDGGRKLNVLGIPMVIRIQGCDTGGIVSAVESHDAPGGGPPPHIHHREDETFQIIEGEYEWTVGGEKFIAQKGATIFAPRGIPHTYRYLGKTPGRLMCIITPSGFEGFFEEIGAMSPQQQQDLPYVIELGRKYGVEFPAPPAT